MTRIEQLISLNPDEFRTDLVNFLHELEYCKSFDEYQDLTWQEPVEKLSDHWFNYVIVAGIIEFYAKRKRFEAPDWVFDEKYTLETEWWALDETYLLMAKH